MDRLWHLTIPAIMSAVTGVAVLSRYVRSQMLEVEPVRRVQVEPELIGAVEVLDPGVPRVEVDHSQLHLLDSWWLLYL